MFHFQEFRNLKRLDQVELGSSVESDSGLDQMYIHHQRHKNDTQYDSSDTIESAVDVLALESSLDDVSSEFVMVGDMKVSPARTISSQSEASTPTQSPSNKNSLGGFNPRRKKGLRKGK